MSEKIDTFNVNMTLLKLQPIARQIVSRQRQISWCLNPRRGKEKQYDNIDCLSIYHKALYPRRVCTGNNRTTCGTFLTYIVRLFTFITRLICQLELVLDKKLWLMIS